MINVINVDPIGVDRVDALAALHAGAFDHPWDAEALRSLLQSPGVLALGDDSTRGFILVRVTLDDAEILTLAVDDRARRQGLGRRLVQAAAAWAQSQGAQSLFLEVAAGNTLALALYGGQHFEPVGRRIGYYAREGGVREDALVLRKGLNLSA